MLVVLAAGMHLLALLAPALSGVNVVWLGLWSLVLCLHWWWLGRHYLFLSAADAVRSFCWSEQGFAVELTDGSRLAVEVDKSSVVWPGAVLLKLNRTDGVGSIRLPLLPDSCDPERLRRLRVVLYGYRFFPGSRISRGAIDS